MVYMIILGGGGGVCVGGLIECMESWNKLGWKGPPEVLSKLLLTLDQVAQGTVQSSFEYLPGWRFHSPAGSLFWLPLW